MTIYDTSLFYYQLAFILYNQIMKYYYIVILSLASLSLGWCISQQDYDKIVEKSASCSHYIYNEHKSIETLNDQIEKAQSYSWDYTGIYNIVHDMKKIDIQDKTYRNPYE